MYSLTVIVLSLIINIATASLNPHQKRTLGTIYYECGRTIVFERIVQDLVADYLNQDLGLSTPFQGILYDPNLNYWILPVPIHLCTSATHTDSTFRYSNAYIVKDQMNKIIDVITEMRNGHYIKCKRIDNSAPEPSFLDPNMEYGYECGHETFSHQTLKLSANEAVSRMGRRKLYPALYMGYLYEPDLKYWVYPILRGNMSFQARKLPESIFFVVINSAGKIIDVIVELKSRDFMKCAITTRAIDDKEDLRVGYLCGLNFFDIEYMKEAAKMAMMKSIDPVGIYPMSYCGPPSFDNGWIYPLYPNGMIYAKGTRRSSSFVVMGLSFNIISAVSKTTKGLQPCQEALRGLDVVPSEKDDYICPKVTFSNDHLVATVDVGCRALGHRDKVYPAKYIGPGFNIPGPYLTWPLLQGKMFYKVAPGYYRVVMNLECQLAGVLVKVKNSNTKFMKCRRRNDQLFPDVELNIPIDEEITRYKNP